MRTILLEHKRLVLEDRRSHIENSWLSFVRILVVLGKTSPDLRSYSLISSINKLSSTLYSQEDGI